MKLVTIEQHPFHSGVFDFIEGIKVDAECRASIRRAAYAYQFNTPACAEYGHTCGHCTECSPNSALRESHGFRDGLSRTCGGKHAIAVYRPGTNGAVLRFPVGRCEGTLYGALSRRLAGWVSFGNAGMRDCAMPNFSCTSPLARQCETQASATAAGAPFTS